MVSGVRCPARAVVARDGTRRIARARVFARGPGARRPGRRHRRRAVRRRTRPDRRRPTVGAPRVPATPLDLTRRERDDGARNRAPSSAAGRAADPRPAHGNQVAGTGSSPPTTPWPSGVFHARGQNFGPTPPPVRPVRWPPSLLPL